MGHTNIEPVQTEWGGLIPGLQAGRFDIITGGMNILAARCENVAFSEPMARIGDGFLVPAGNPKGIGNYDDIRESGAVMVTGAGYSNIEAARTRGRGRQHHAGSGPDRDPRRRAGRPRRCGRGHLLHHAPARRQQRATRSR
jgi:ABC-type amino acid transport substrate-binding protein